MIPRQAGGRRVSAIVSKSKADAWLEKHGEAMKRIALSEVKDDLSRVLRLAASEEIIMYPFTGRE